MESALIFFFFKLLADSNNIIYEGVAELICCLAH
jgi:hypothetical protein